jgi:hypothetical protein
MVGFDSGLVGVESPMEVGHRMVSVEGVENVHDHKTRSSVAYYRTLAAEFASAHRPGWCSLSLRGCFANLSPPGSPASTRSPPTVRR